MAGTAAAGSDYIAANGTLSSAPGQISKIFMVQIIGDRHVEPHETIFVNLSNSTNAIIPDGHLVGTIVDDEPRISIGDVSGENKTTLFTFTVTLPAACNQAVTMSYRTVDGTATTGSGDYMAKTGMLTFAPGETTKTITQMRCIRAGFRLVGRASQPDRIRLVNRPQRLALIRNRASNGRCSRTSASY